jgi:hypothetical protein
MKERTMSFNEEFSLARHLHEYIYQQEALIKHRNLDSTEDKGYEVERA